VRRFLKCVQNTVATHDLWSPKESFIVAVSGGADSLCLLDVLVLLSQKYDFALHVVHVNYRLRGSDSDLDEQLVRECSRFYGLTLSILHPKKIPSKNLEAGLRDIRYQYFEKVRRQKNADHIAVAHHQDDQAETFLLRLLRGAGMRGLSAMRPKNNFVIRPLIDMGREEILRYLKERDIVYREDQSNSDPQFLRNRVRHDLIPYIAEYYQPKIKKVLADTAALLAADYALLESLPSLSPKKKSGAIEFSVTDVQHLPEALIRHELRLLLKPYYQEKSPPKGIIDEVQKLLKSAKNKHQTLVLPGLKIERKGATVRLLNFSM
jgi:tRNA(Ile)-lysidine synthase